MRVIIVNRSDAYEKLGGDTVQMLQTKEALVELGVTCDIVLGEQCEDLYKKYDIVHLFNIQTEDFTYKEALKVKKVNKKLVISPIWWNYEKLMNDLPDECYTDKALLFKRLFGKKILIYMKNKNQKIRNKKRVKILDMADIILPNSKMEVQDLNDSFNKNYNIKCKVVYNGVSDKFFNVENVEFSEELHKAKFKEFKYVTQVGRVEIGKNTLLTIRACKELNIPLVLVGAFPNDKYKQMCLDEATGANVYFAGPKTTDEIIEINNYAKAHILPSYRETPGLASLEAAILGCNIVSTEVGSTREYFRDEACYCNPNNYESIKEAISEAWNNENNEELKKIIFENYTWNVAAVQTKESYEKVIGVK